MLKVIVINENKMKLVCHKINLRERNTDFAYWQTQSYQARLEALEEIRQEYHQWKDNSAESRLQRVHTISQR